MARAFVLAMGFASAAVVVVWCQWLSRVSVAIEDGTPVPASAHPPVEPGFTFDPSHPAAAVFERTSVDAGGVLAGKPARFEFVVRNTGTGPLQIVARPHCGCTVAHFDPTIAPGGEGRITASLSTDRFSGPVQKSIGVSTNDPQHRNFDLQVSATIVDPIQVEQSPGQTIRLPLHQSASTQFCVRIDPAASVRITSVSCDQAYMTAEFTGPADDDSERARVYKVRVTFTADAPLGESTSTVALATDSAQRPAVHVRLHCEKGIVPSPPALYFGVIPENASLPVVRSVVLRRAAEPFHIIKAECNLPALDLETADLSEHAGYRLTLSYTGGGSPGAHEGTLRIETDDPDQSLFELPVSYRIQALHQSHRPVASTSRE